MVKKVWTTRSPSGPDSGASEKRTRAAYVPFLNLLARVRISVCLVDSPVPAVELLRFMMEFVPSLAKVTFSGAQVAPGTPGPPELDRTLQPWVAMAGSV